MNPDPTPPDTCRALCDDGGAPPCECERDLEMAVRTAACALLALCVFAIGLGVLWLLGVLG